MSFTTSLLRYTFKRSDDKRDTGLTVPEDVAVCRDIRYGTDQKWQILDIYRPKNVKGRLPVIVNFHGGGWVYGSKETYQYYCMELAREGFAVVNPTYRLAPEHRFPAAFEDLNSVFLFVLNHAGKCGFDTDRIFGIGDSAGATGMAIYACVLTDPAFAKQFPVKAPAGLHLRGTSLNCGLYSMKGKRDIMQEFLPKQNPEEALRMLHVPKYITPDFPPCYLLTAKGDFNCEEPQKLIPALEKNGIRYQCKVYGDEQNPLGHVFHCNVKSADAKAANQDEIAFFKSLC